MLSEVIVATGVLTTAMLALAQLFAMSLVATDAAKTTTLASVLAERKAEELRTFPWANLAEGAGSIDYLDERGGFLASGGEPPPRAMFARRWAAARLPARPDESVVIEIFVERVGGRDAREAGGRFPGMAHITCVRTRHAE